MNGVEDSGAQGNVSRPPGATDTIRVRVRVSSPVGSQHAAFSSAFEWEFTPF